MTAPLIVPFSTAKCEGSFVKLPDGAGFIKVVNGNNLSYDPNMDAAYGSWASITLPEGSWQLIGAVKDLTEQQAQSMIGNIPDWKALIYRNYTAPAKDYRDIVESSFDTALESFFSLMESLQVYSVNPIEKPVFEAQFVGHMAQKDYSFLQKMKQWKEVEDRTGNWIVLIKST